MASSPSSPTTFSSSSSSSNFALKKGIIIGALLLMSGISYHVAMTSTFHNNVANDAQFAPPSKHHDRGLDDEKEERPWRVKVKPKPVMKWGVAEKEDDLNKDKNAVKEAVADEKLQDEAEARGRQEAQEQEQKNANERLKKETNDAVDADENIEKKDTNTTSKKKHKPLNILLLYGDDWRHDSIGVASNGLVKTPFLDNLATQGVRFTHNCVTTSVCWVSRATLYTGQYVSRHKSTEPMKPEFYAGWNKTFPYLLREAGYYFGHGKSFASSHL